METESETIAEDQKRAEHFNKHFASVHKADKLTEPDRERLRLLKRKEKAPGANISLFEDDLTQAELSTAMRKLKSRKSPGPDSIHNEMLTHLGTEAKAVILDLINLTWRTGAVPAVWEKCSHNTHPEER